MSGRLAVAVLAIFVVIGIAVYALPILMPSEGLGGSIGVTMKDKDGNPLAFAQNGVIVTGMTVKFSHSLTATEGTLEDILVDGTLTVTTRVNKIGSTSYNPKLNDYIKYDASGSESYDFTLSSLIGVPTSEGMTYGWVIHIEARLAASAVIGGDPLQTSWTGAKDIIIAYTTAGLILTGEINA